MHGMMQRFQRNAAGAEWAAVGSPIAVVVGKAGLGWAVGTTSSRSLRGSGDPLKSEGDHKSPAGVFRLGTAFGYAPEKLSGSKLPYRFLRPSTECVDDPHSRFYNQLLDRSSVAPDWHSAEHMRDAGEAYRLGIVLEQNPTAQPRAGSCVFVHIWAGEDAGTEGCTAMPEPQIRSLLEWLNPDARPLLVQLPSTQYLKLERKLRLPPLPQ